ncbi:hypothetical protein C4D60_Mb06t18330 [Musa balbisiana]|uniref:Uncharacterized protein n=1 Tax=Musa balbisiana TaxID=52838 RepID=A0A4S8IRF3_MUSBA|nr:hypothetical protein C4D60_Mb06t18330 [Musa balbisiana]
MLGSRKAEHPRVSFSRGAELTDAQHRATVDVRNANLFAFHDWLYAPDNKGKAETKISPQAKLL